jgi:adenylylsulfate kinase
LGIFLANKPICCFFVPLNYKTHCLLSEHIHPIFDRLLQRSDRERRLGQRSRALWLTGLSGSGKSTIALHLERRLYNEGFFAQVLDGDNIRHGINNNLDFSEAGRRENIRRIAEVAKLYLHSGIITINSFISPTRELRLLASGIIGPEDFIEIYINAPLEVCEARDVKGLYQKARAGLIKGFTGIDDPYEAPENPALEIDTARLDVEQSVSAIMGYLQPMITFNTTDK